MWGNSRDSFKSIFKQFLEFNNLYSKHFEHTQILVILILGSNILEAVKYRPMRRTSEKAPFLFPSFKHATQVSGEKCGCVKYTRSFSFADAFTPFLSIPSIISNPFENSGEYSCLHAIIVCTRASSACRGAIFSNETPRFSFMFRADSIMLHLHSTPLRFTTLTFVSRKRSRDKIHTRGSRRFWNSLVNRCAPFEVNYMCVMKRESVKIMEEIPSRALYFVGGKNPSTV